MRFVSSVARGILGSESASRPSRPVLMEALETRQFLSASLAPSQGTQPLVPAVTLPAVQSTGVTIKEVAGNTFTAVVGKVKGLDKSLLKNLKGLQAVITWNDYTGTNATSNGVLSVNGDTLVVTGTHLYHVAAEHIITVAVSTVPSSAATKPVLLATIHSKAEVAINPIGVTFGIPSAGTSFTGVVGEVKGFDKATLQKLSGLTVTIAWGDHTANTSGKLSADSTGLVSVTGTHTYAIDGQYSVKITIQTTPPAGSAVPIVVLAVIHSTADVAFIQPVGVTFTAEADEPFSGVVGKVKGLDQTTLHQLSSLQAVITWGNGPATSAGKLSVDNAGVLSVTGMHTYAHAGKYAVQTVVETIPPVLDPPATTTIAPVVLATINSYATVTPDTEGGVKLDEIVSKSFTAILGTYDFDNTANYVQTATITWGDGKSTKGTIVRTGPDADDWAVKGTHTYAKIGTYHVQIIVTATPAPTGGISNPIILVVANIKSTIIVLP